MKMVSPLAVSQNNFILLTKSFVFVNKQADSEAISSPTAKKMKLSSDSNVENILCSKSVVHDTANVTDVAHSLKSLSESFRFVSS